ncbi:Pycsar system effector family protein [Neolewinella persica]|uniref:Pycsar system effector family protein n=1 Tax=Neolewinella persica TaxID=70998 RepID=UPI0003606A75|nr:Pycsar system effector family protein [Neolewinella persica]
MSSKQADADLMAELGIDKTALKKLKKRLRKADTIPEKGIETWFRLASKNLYTRRQIVDTKSNILVTVNSIIMSIVLGSLYPRLAQDPHLLWAVGPMVLTNISSMTFAIFATRPKIQRGLFSSEEITSGTAGLMTFDDFYKMPLSDYEAAISQVMEDREFLYGTIKRDIHRLGVDLSRRYSMIRISYDVFLFGTILSVFMFGACHVFF